MIVRVVKRKRYTSIANEALEDRRLSWKARGILAYLLGRPDDWRVSIRGLTALGPQGRDAVQAGLTELEQCGYLVRHRYQDAGGNWLWISNVYEEPMAENPEPCTGYPYAGQPDTENPDDYLTTDEPKTEQPPRGVSENLNGDDRRSDPSGQRLSPEDAFAQARESLRRKRRPNPKDEERSDSAGEKESA
jgi:hypothetical protein